MSEKYSCVVDTHGNYIEFVLQLLTPQPDGGEEWVVQHYTLKEGERLVDTMPPNRKPHTGATGLICPRWGEDTTAWMEGATTEEIAAWELEHPAPEPAGPTELQLAQQSITGLELNDIEQGQAITDLELLLLETRGETENV